jgi:hypothetical protein
MSNSVNNYTSDNGDVNDARRQRVGHSWLRCSVYSTSHHNNKHNAGTVPIYKNPISFTAQNHLLQIEKVALTTSITKINTTSI